MKQTWIAQDRRGLPRTRYYWYAERHPRYRPWPKRRLGWKHRAHMVEAMPVSVVPAWFAQSMVCIGIHEEGGQNSVAGRYGFIYPPSTYGGVAAQLAGTYGESWLDWPQEPQLEVAYMLWGEFGWSPWSTAPGCGL